MSAEDPSRPTRAFDLVRRLSAAVNAADYDAMRGMLGDDIRWEHSEDPLGGERVLEGPDAVICFMQKLHHVCEGYRVAHSEFAGSGDTVVCDIAIQGHGRRSGAPVYASYTEVMTIGGGRVRRLRAFADRVDALREAGVD